MVICNGKQMQLYFVKRERPWGATIVEKLLYCQVPVGLGLVATGGCFEDLSYLEILR